MTNLLEFPTGLLTIFLILVALYVLFSVVAWAAGDDEPVDEIRQGREKRP
jgi:hypothetical protein